MYLESWLLTLSQLYFYSGWKNRSFTTSMSVRYIATIYEIIPDGL